MARIASLLILMIVALAPIAASADPSKEASNLFDRWVAAFNANDIDTLVNLYAPDATFVGTLGKNLLHGRSAVRAYFARLAGSGDHVTIGEREIVALDDHVAYITGSYEFTTAREVRRRTSPARFSMILIKHGGTWLIVHHHSSRRPPDPVVLPSRRAENIEIGGLAVAARAEPFDIRPCAGCRPGSLAGPLSPHG